MRHFQSSLSTNCSNEKTKNLDVSTVIYKLRHMLAIKIQVDIFGTPKQSRDAFSKIFATEFEAALNANI